MTKSFFLAILVFVGVVKGFGQDTKFDAVERSLSGMGVVHFVEGDSAKGEIFCINSLKIDFNGKTHSPKSVESFYFHDPGKAGKRFFLALEYDDRRSGINDFYFFEMLFEFESFALLRKTDPKELYTLPAPTPAFSSSNGKAYATYEEIYVFDKDGNTEPFLQTRYLERQPYAKNTITTRIVNDKLLYSHLKPHMPELNKFVKTNKLSFEDKDDFLKIMERYKELTK